MTPEPCCCASRACRCASGTQIARDTHLKPRREVGVWQAEGLRGSLDASRHRAFLLASAASVAVGCGVRRIARCVLRGSDIAISGRGRLLGGHGVLWGVQKSARRGLEMCHDDVSLDAHKGRTSAAAAGDSVSGMACAAAAGAWGVSSALQVADRRHGEPRRNSERHSSHVRPREPSVSHAYPSRHQRRCPCARACARVAARRRPAGAAQQPKPAERARFAARGASALCGARMHCTTPRARHGRGRAARAAARLSPRRRPARRALFTGSRHRAYRINQMLRFTPAARAHPQAPHPQAPPPQPPPPAEAAEAVQPPSAACRCRAAAQPCTARR